MSRLETFLILVYKNLSLVYQLNTLLCHANVVDDFRGSGHKFHSCDQILDKMLDYSHLLGTNSKIHVGQFHDHNFKVTVIFGEKKKCHAIFLDN